nr:MAG TPA: hypothetical protein [Caudoviricetes sp.]
MTTSLNTLNDTVKHSKKALAYGTTTLRRWH